MMNKKTGFTLIEMMLVVALIAILAGIALPAYNNYVNRSKIKTAQADLAALSLNFENAYQRQLSYPTSNYADTAALIGAFKGWNPASKSGDFSFSSANASASSYEIVATGVSGGINGCKLTLTNNARTLTNCPYLNNGDWL